LVNNLLLHCILVKLISKYGIGEVEHENINFSHGIDRESEGGSGFLAYFNIVCVVAGTGALSLPYALRQGGWIGRDHIVST
jgi:hypothetical protein